MGDDKDDNNDNSSSSSTQGGGNMGTSGAGSDTNDSGMSDLTVNSSLTTNG